MQTTHPSDQPEGDNNSQALNPEATAASASITTTTINPDQESENMTTTTTTLVAGDTHTGIVTSKNQHGATVSIDGQVAFLPKGESDLSDLAKGTEVAVTVIDTEGAKPRVAIASPEIVTYSTAQPAVEAVEPSTEAAVEETGVADGNEENVVTVSAIDALAAAWGASRGTIRGSKPSSKKGKTHKVRTTDAATALAHETFGNAVSTQTWDGITAEATPDSPAVVEAPAETAVVETPAEAPVVAESAPVDSPKLAYLKTVKEGDVVKAAVKFKKDFGAFLTTANGLGFGLLHVSEMPGAKPEQRKAYLDGLRYKQELTLTVINVDLEQQRLGLSLVAGEKESFFDGLKVGAVVEGTISGTKEIGAFINLGATTGFLHVSEVDGKTREQRDGRLASFKKGEKLELVVIDVNREKKEVRLSERRLVIATLSVDAEVHGVFAGVRNNQVVVDLNFGGRGYLPKKNGKRYEHGEPIVARVRSVDVVNNAVELV